MNKQFTASLCALLLMSGCTTPLQQPGPAKSPADRDTSYSVEDRADGFTVSVSYDRHQFFPETAAVLVACKAALLVAAYEVADRRGRAIEPVNEQRIRISTGRNGITGFTSCEASVPVRWKQ